MNFPHLDDPRILRNVLLGDTGYRLLTWDTCLYLESIIYQGRSAIKEWLAPAGLTLSEVARRFAVQVRGAGERKKTNPRMGWSVSLQVIFGGSDDERRSETCDRA